MPNSEFLQKNVINWTHSDQLMRRWIKVGVAYGSATREVAKIIAKSLDEHGKVLKCPEPVVFFDDFADSALLFTAYFWVEISDKFDARTVDSDLRHMLDKRLREAGITIAFPQLDVHIEQTRPLSFQIASKPTEDQVLTGKAKENGGDPLNAKGSPREKSAAKIAAPEFGHPPPG